MAKTRPSSQEAQTEINLEVLHVLQQMNAKLLVLEAWLIELDKQVKAIEIVKRKLPGSQECAFNPSDIFLDGSR